MDSSRFTQEQQELGRQWLKDAREWILARTVPILARAEDGYPVLEGSGFLLKIADTLFLVTAAHVMSSLVRDTRSVAIAIAEGQGVLRLDDLPVHISTDETHVDLAWIRLTQEQEARLAPHRPFLRLDQVDTERAAPKQGLYIVAGFPVQRSRPDPAAALMHLGSYCLSTSLYDGDWSDFKEGTSIVLTLTPNVIDENGDLARRPDLRGISGCGIWRIIEEKHPAPGHWDVAAIRLAGIEHGITSKVIKGLLAFHLVDSIKRMHADLAAPINIARP